MADKKSMFDELAEEIADLRAAKALLEEVWDEVGPYNNGPIPDTTLAKMQKYFHFDDSE